MPKPYASPIDIGFDRDIDPTIIEEKEIRESFGEISCAWASKPETILSDVSESELPAWPFLDDPAAKLKDLIIREDKAGLRWIVLYEHQSKTERYVRERGGEHGIGQQKFRFLMSVVVRKNEVNEIVDKLNATQDIDTHWGGSDMTDEAFLFEAPWRTTWPSSQWRFDKGGAPEGVGVAFPVSG